MLVILKLDIFMANKWWIYLDKVHLMRITFYDEAEHTKNRTVSMCHWNENAEILEKSDSIEVLHLTE